MSDTEKKPVLLTKETALELFVFTERNRRELGVQISEAKRERDDLDSRIGNMEAAFHSSREFLETYRQACLETFPPARVQVTVYGDRDNSGTVETATAAEDVRRSSPIV